MKKLLWIMALGQSVLFAAAPPAPSPLKKGGISTAYCEASKVGEYDNPKDSTVTTNGHLRTVVVKVGENPSDALKGKDVRSTAWAALGCSPRRGSKHCHAQVKRIGSDWHHYKRNQNLDDAKNVLQEAAETDLKARIKEETFSDRCEHSACGRRFSEKAPGWITLLNQKEVRLHKACADRWGLPVICPATVLDFDLFPEVPTPPASPEVVRSPKTPSRIRGAAVQALSNIIDAREASEEDELYR
jgi:hypothetical protein